MPPLLCMRKDLNMVSIDRIQSGIARYLDTEIVPKMSGVNKWLVSAVASAYISDAPELLRKLNGNKAIAALNLIDEAGNVDVEKIYQLLKPAAAKCPAPITLPIIGTLTFTEQDVDSLYAYIMQS